MARIEEAFNRAEDAIVEKNLDALMAVYSERYRYQALTKVDMWKVWVGCLNNTIGSVRSIHFLASS